ncbi:SDR family NAD(P)-dependent oxidoreductase [Limibacter armeniacum]|uniref:SDR family NAD(P)-dependent oxidoreductase n=1 Tax=Limibacter armeniacum TaxID=466084 RepID=UPI002FE55F80
MKLENKIAIVAGGTGSVGEGIVKVLMSEGATVIVPTRSKDKEVNLKEYVRNVGCGKLNCIRASIGLYDGAQDFKKEVLEQYGHIDLVIASIGGWYAGHTLDEMPIDDWDMVMDNNLRAHFVFARTFIPILKKQESGTYININGGAQEMIIPWSGVISVVSAAQNKMTEVFAKEAEGHHYNVYTVAAYTMVNTRKSALQATPDWVTAEDIGNYIVRLSNNEVTDKSVRHKLTERP